jgi:hypothetical protein
VVVDAPVPNRKRDDLEASGKVGNRAFNEIAGEGWSRSIGLQALRTPLPSHAIAG